MMTMECESLSEQDLKMAGLERLSRKAEYLGGGWHITFLSQRDAENGGRFDLRMDFTCRLVLVRKNVNLNPADS